MSRGTDAAAAAGWIIAAICALAIVGLLFLVWSAGAWLASLL